MAESNERIKYQSSNDKCTLAKRRSWSSATATVTWQRREMKVRRSHIERRGSWGPSPTEDQAERKTKVVLCCKSATREVKGEERRGIAARSPPSTSPAADRWWAAPGSASQPHVSFLPDLTTRSPQARGRGGHAWY